MITKDHVEIYGLGFFLAFLFVMFNSPLNAIAICAMIVAYVAASWAVKNVHTKDGDDAEDGGNT